MSDRINNPEPILEITVGVPPALEATAETANGLIRQIIDSPPGSLNVFGQAVQVYLMQVSQDPDFLVKITRAPIPQISSDAQLNSIFASYLPPAMYIMRTAIDLARRSSSQAQVKIQTGRVSLDLVRALTLPKTQYAFREIVEHLSNLGYFEQLAASAELMHGTPLQITQNLIISLTGQQENQQPELDLTVMGGVLAPWHQVAIIQAAVLLPGLKKYDVLLPLAMHELRGEIDRLSHLLDRPRYIPQLIVPISPVPAASTTPETPTPKPAEGLIVVNEDFVIDQVVEMLEAATSPETAFSRGMVRLRIQELLQRELSPDEGGLIHIVLENFFSTRAKKPDKLEVAQIERPEEITHGKKQVSGFYIESDVAGRSEIIAEFAKKVRGIKRIKGRKKSNEKKPIE